MSDPIKSDGWETPMRNLLLTTCVTGALMAAGGAPSLAGDLKLAMWPFGSPPTACEKDCRTQADQCREQCAHPEDPEQCIVACSSSECRKSCADFETACDRRCESSKDKKQ